MICPICKFEGNFNIVKAFDIFNKNSELIRHQCSKCSLIFGTMDMIKLPEIELSKQYNILYENYSECDTSKIQSTIFNKCFNDQKDKKYLNIGGGKTNLSKHLPNIDLYEYDPHVKKLHSKFLNSFDDVLKIAPFDGIFTNNVLEHYQDPIENLKMQSSILKNDGMIIHSTPCFSYKYENTRFHLFFFLGKSIDYLADAASLKVINFENQNVKGFIKCT